MLGTGVRDGAQRLCYPLRADRVPLGGQRVLSPLVPDLGSDRRRFCRGRIGSSPSLLVRICRMGSTLWELYCSLMVTTKRVRLPRRASRTTGIELLLYTGLAIVGLFLGGHHVIGGLLPGLSWFAIGAIKGISIGMIGENLVRSKELFEAARDDGTHMLPVPNKTLQPTGEDARRLSVIVSCGEPLWV